MLQDGPLPQDLIAKRGISLLSLGRKDEAAAILDQVVALNPQEFGDLITTVGDAYAQQALPYRAIECYRAALSGEAVNHAEVGTKLARVLTQIGCGEEALEARKAAFYAPEGVGGGDLGARLSLAEALAVDGNVAGAVNLLD